MTQEIQLPIVLRECPHCGKPARSERVRGARLTLVNCQEIQCGSVVARTHDEAVAKWNTRTTDATIQGLVRALEDVISEYRAHDTKGIDAMYQIASDALKSVRGKS